MRYGRSRPCTSAPAPLRLHLCAPAPLRLHLCAAAPLRRCAPVLLHPCTPAHPQVDTTALRVLSAVPISPATGLPASHPAPHERAFQGAPSSPAPKPSPPSSGADAARHDERGTEPPQAQLEALLAALNIPPARHAAVRRMPVDAQRLLLATWRQRELAERQRAATVLARWTFVANAPRRRRLVRACREAALAHLRAESVSLAAAGVPAEAIARLKSLPLAGHARQLRVLQGLLGSGGQSSC